MSEQINHKLLSVKIEQKNIKDPKDWKGGQLWNVGVKVDEEWHNGTLWNERSLEEFENMPLDTPVTLMFYQEEYNNEWYNKFRLPTKADHLQKRVEQLEEFVTLAIDKYPDLKDIQVSE